MDFMDLLRLLLWYAALFIVLGLTNSLLAALAFRVNLGAAEFPMEAREFWTRSVLAGFVLAAYTALAVFFSLILFSPTAYALFGMLMVPYPVLAVYLYNWAYALDDLLESFKIFLIHHFLPVVVLSLCFVFFFNVASFVRFVTHA